MYDCAVPGLVQVRSCSIDRQPRRYASRTSRTRFGVNRSCVTAAPLSASATAFTTAAGPAIAPLTGARLWTGRPARQPGASGRAGRLRANRCFLHIHVASCLSASWALPSEASPARPPNGWVESLVFGSRTSLPRPVACPQWLLEAWTRRFGVGAGLAVVIGGPLCPELTSVR